ncbi:Transporter of the ATP-binding cassette (ABC) [Lithohypha guttulata]|uniref:Transporter of the ATP-binding cassette (ABC) n=1 Tax=Lithohypha guttulata TaxID=1690604 RepID=A0AAN7Y8I7_9EURO|nr:Transporter of the ATP-binding cassette (ABC) [Lithohypha guttulata]
MRPIWFYDDIDPHFQRLYLQAVFPLTVCALSLIVLLVKSTTTFVQTKTRQQHQPLVDIEEDEDLTLQKTTTDTSTFDVDKPKGEAGVVTFELVILGSQLAINIAAFLYDHTSTALNSITYIVLWSYLILLAILRLYSTTTGNVYRFLKLWNHCAVIYGFEWLCEVMLFRSAIIRPKSSLSRNIIATRFALTCVLSFVVLISRRGNRAVKVEYEDDIEPSREPLASLLGTLTFAWIDSIIWRGFKRPLEMTDVWNVSPKDKAEHVLERFRQIKKTHMLAVRLLLFFKKQLLLQGLWCAISSIAMFMPTLLLKAILEYVEDPVGTSTNAAWLYAVLLFVTGLVQALGDGQSLWIGRKICIQIRGVIIGEVYSKVLRRKAAATAESEPAKEDLGKPSSLWQKLQFWKTKESKPSMDGRADSQKAVSVAASNGTVINLMSIDSFKVAEICAYLHFLWAATPVQLVMAIALLYKVLGYSSFAGIVLMVLVLPWNMWIAKSFTKAQKAIMAATDARIHATNEVLQNIRIIKYFAWEKRFEENVNEKRQTELTALWRKYILWAAAYTIWGGIPILITFTSFLIFTKVEKRPLVPSIAFPALSMFSLLRIPLDQLADMVAHVQESKVSVDRVEEFLREEETEKYLQLKHSRQASPHETRIALKHATLTWGSSAETSKSTGTPFRLIDMDIDFIVGKLNVIAGPTGSGKTSLLLALLGEMQLLDGIVHIPGGYSRQHLRPDPTTGLTESVAYCAQQAWLVNATIRENILFASPFDARRYKAVIDACALKRDLEILDAGDQTLVGEKGITLSGGQKQRISLARALYSNSKHILLDDCLSAVDSHTAKHIFDEALMGKMMIHRTCILVSHNVALAVPQASHVVVLNNGKILCQGSPASVAESGHLGDELARSVPASRIASAVPSRTPSPGVQEHGIVNDVSDGPTATGEMDVAEESGFKADRKFVDTRIEAKATGSVGWRTIKMYLQAMGPWYYWIFAASGFVAVQLGSVATNVWIRQWANAYHTSSQSNHMALSVLQSRYAHSAVPAGSLVLQGLPATYITSRTDLRAHENVDSSYYLGVYALIGTAYIIICLLRELLLFKGSLQASRVLHQQLLGKILRATFRFFDSTPLGQLTNRFSKDLQSIDQEVAPVAIGLLHSAASVVTIVVLITTITPGFLIPGVFIALIYILTGMFYIKASRDLKRLESVQRSPLFQHFGETLSGVVTIRAYGDEARFVNDSHHKVNTHNRPFIYLWATNRWLAFRVDCAGALVAFFSAMFVVQNVGSIDAGAAGLSLSYAITFTQNVLWLVRLYAANEQNMNAVERVQEYIDVEQEASAQIPETKPAANWPSQGAVHFINYSTSYRKDLEPVLRGVTFKIAAAEKVGIVGRTGAGKSSLALALFRGLEAQEGKILIDDVDIGMIGLQDLREAITIVPQDPTLFTGTLRSNLDPFGLFTDEEIFTALRRVQLITSASRNVSESSPSLPSNASTLNGAESLRENEGTNRSANGTLSSEAPTLVKFASNTKENQNVFYDLSTAIAESGSNLSQGQRQLLCLARALLKSPKVLVMDEATASIDYATDSKIQDTLRELKENTIITIAHRLQTIIDYDKVLVLDKGEVVEYAHPWELVQKEDGMFRGMCETSGDLELLRDLAKKAWDSKRLIDV